MLQLGFVNFKKGAYVLVEGKADADRFYIVQSGRVMITKETEVVSEEGGNTLGPGDFIGVVSSMSGHTQIENAIAATDVTLIAVRKNQYSELIEKNTPVAMKIIQSFSRRMRYLDEALTRLTLKKSGGEDVNHLFNVGEYYAKQGNYNLAFYAYYHYLKNAPSGEYSATARTRFMALKSVAKAVYVEPKPDEINRVYPKNTMIFCESQPGSDLFIIQKGKVKISKVVDKNEVILAILNPGDIFGEMALLENKPRSASAVSYEDCSLLAVNRANFNQMVKTQPQLIARLTTTLADRIWMMYKQLANTLINDVQGKMYDMMCIQLEKDRVPFNGNSYVFNFGPRELASMCGIAPEKQEPAVRELLNNRTMGISEGKMTVASTAEIFTQANYFKKLQNIENSRRMRSFQHTTASW